MPAESRRRKAALVEAGVSQQQVAEATGVDAAMVSHVLAGRRLHMPEALKVMGYISAATNRPLDELWPSQTQAA